MAKWQEKADDQPPDQAQYESGLTDFGRLGSRTWMNWA